MIERVVKVSVIAILLAGMQLGLGSCEKDELTEPATVTCQFIAETRVAMNGLLTIERFDINLSKMDISGRRANENDMFFSRSFDRETGHFEVLGSETSSIVLQIPQGVYETLVYYITVSEEDYEFEYGSADDDDETGDLAEYVRNARPGILITAQYVSGDKVFPVIIALNDDIRRLVLDAQQDGSATVILQKEISSLATITFDPAYWFTSVTPAMLESAIAFPMVDEEAVFISDEYNEFIYNQIAGRIQGSATLTIERQ